MATKRLLVVGAGRLAKNLLTAWMEQRLFLRSNIVAVTRTERSAMAVGAALKIHTQSSLLIPPQFTPDIVLVAVKPLQMDEALAALKQLNLPPRTLIVSLVTGISVKRIKTYFPNQNPVIRVITNTPVKVREGMSVVIQSPEISRRNMRQVERLFDAVGAVRTLDEKMADALIGIVGSGPGFFFEICRSLALGAQASGIPEKEAIRLTSQVMLGAAQMLLKTGISPQSLKDDVVTPAGTTMAGLSVMERAKVAQTLKATVVAATKRAKELGKRR